MECNSYIHHFLPDEINILDAEFECLKRGRGIHFQRSKSDLFAVIDRMGQLSAKAQGLTGSITSGSKLLYSDHRLYLLKDTTPSSCQVIGILKVGRKNLFIYDMHGAQHEMSPLCVLDFYVHESRQRQGCGRKLFDFMLAKEGVNPRHLAIDRPSHKFLAFLGKHYALTHAIPQMYKFVIFQGFFRERGEISRGNRGAIGRPSSVNKVSSSRRQERNQQGQPQQVAEIRSESRLLPEISSASASTSQRQNISPPRRVIPASAHVQLNGSNLVSNLKSLSIREASANCPGSAGDGPPHVDAGPLKTHVSRTDHLRSVGETNCSRRDTQSAPVGAAAGPIQRDVSNWTAATVGNNYTYAKGLSRNQQHTRLW